MADPTDAVGYAFPDEAVTYNKRDLILYALGIQATELHFTYENDKRFAAFPTYPLVLPLKGSDTDVNVFAERLNLTGIPSLPKIPLDKLLHGEQYLEVTAPLPLKAELIKKSRIVGIHDKGRGLLMEQETTLVDKSGKLYARMVSSSFIVGIGGFKKSKSIAPRIPSVEIPSKEADVVVTASTSLHQAALYRLSGDFNPLHIDPAISRKLPFKKPILHGLCSLGYGAHAVLEQFAHGDPSCFKSISCRFATPVFPGETLQTHMWKMSEADDQMVIGFLVKVVERDDAIALSNGVATLFVAHSASKL